MLSVLATHTSQEPACPTHPRNRERGPRTRGDTARDSPEPWVLAFSSWLFFCYCSIFSSNFQERCKPRCFWKLLCVWQALGMAPAWVHSSGWASLGVWNFWRPLGPCWVLFPLWATCWFSVKAPRILPLSSASSQSNKGPARWVRCHQRRHLLVASWTAASPCYFRGGPETPPVQPRPSCSDVLSGFSLSCFLSWLSAPFLPERLVSLVSMVSERSPSLSECPFLVVSEFYVFSVFLNSSENPNSDTLERALLGGAIDFLPRWAWVGSLGFALVLWALPGLPPGLGVASFGP